MSEMNNRSTYDFAAALRGEELKEVERSAPGPDRPSYDFAAMLRQSEELVPSGPTEEEAGAGLQAAEATDEPEGKEAGEELADATAVSLAGAGGKTRRFFESERGQVVLAGAEFAAGSVVGVAIAEILKLDPTWEAGIVIAAQSALGLSRLGTEFGARTIEAAEIRFSRFAKLSARVAGEKGLAGVLRSVKNLATRIQYRPFVAGLSAGIIGHSAFEMITGHSIFPDASAAEPTVAVEPGAGVGETPADAGGAQPVPEAAPGNVLPHLGGEIPAEDLLPQPGDAEAIVRQTAEAAEAAKQAALEAATHVVEVQPGDTLTGLIDAAGGNAYGKDFTDTVLQSANILTGPQNPNRDMAQALIEFIKAHPGGVNWRDAINGVGDLAKQTVGGLPLKDAIAQATRMIYPGQEIKVVVGAAMP